MHGCLGQHLPEQPDKTPDPTIPHAPTAAPGLLLRGDACLPSRRRPEQKHGLLNHATLRTFPHCQRHLPAIVGEFGVDGGGTV